LISDLERQALECLELAAQADDPVVQESLLRAAESLRFRNLSTPAAPLSHSSRQQSAD